MDVGQRVCAKGRGTDAFAHWHGAVIRLTKTMIVVQSDRGAEHRFRRESKDSIPYSAYGGARIATTCQQPKKRA
jgi:hypothetical protein